jgi:hypothetical protein
LLHSFHVRALTLSLLGIACGASDRDSGGTGDPGAGGTSNAGQGGAVTSSGGDAGAPATGGSGASTSSGGDAGSAGSAGSAGTGGVSCLPELPLPEDCPDAIEGDVLGRFTVTLEVDAETELSTVNGIAGSDALRVDTQAGFLVTLRYAAPEPIDALGLDELRVVLRGSNTNTGWQGNVPALTVEDDAGLRRTYTPPGVLFSSDGATWVDVRVPLGGGSGWGVSGDEVDWNAIAAIELTADTWESGFVLDVDGLGFVAAGTVCAAACPDACNGRGRCDSAALGCVCEVGADGEDCATCRDGFELEGEHCALVDDGEYDVWPNAVSSVNGDAWLQVHHQDIARLEPRVLALNFVNPSDPNDVEALLDDVIAGFREGSRVHGYADAESEPQLEYQLEGVIDLRDGVDGRPAAPGDWIYDNSTLMPRRAPEETGAWRFDYAELFSLDFAEHYGFEDPGNPGSYLPLCELIEQGLLHELWIVGSGDVATDVNAAEVLEHKQRYDQGGNPIEGSFDSCAGNGCFDVDVPQCARSVRIGFVNYNRGPGCYLHSQGHGIESTARRKVAPAFSDWFLPFAGFDLDQRYDLSGESFYELIGEPESATYPTPDELVLHLGSGDSSVKPYLASCGNVHFPPNAGDHYDYGSTTPVDSGCADFGRNVLECRELDVQELSAADWTQYETLSPDCGGAFLVWWFQNMPGRNSQQFHADGTAMLSIWPFLFY